MRKVYLQTGNCTTARHLLRAAGFTMVEMLVTVAVGIILVAVAAPQYKQFIQSQNTQAEANNLANDLMFARAEAVKEGQYVSICVANTTMSGCAASGGWNNGWIVYANPGTSATASYVVGTGVLLKKQAAFTSSDTVSTNPSITMISFNRDGFAAGLSASTGQIFKFQTASTNTAATRCVWLNLLGTPTLQLSGATAITGQGTNTC